MLILSVDVETSGLNPEKHQILSVGVVVEDTTKKLPFHKIPKFHCAIVREEIVGGLFALNMNRDLIEADLLFCEFDGYKDILNHF